MIYNLAVLLFLLNFFYIRWLYYAKIDYGSKTSSLPTLSIMLIIWYFVFLVVGKSEERIRFMPLPSELNKVSINRLNWNLKSLWKFHFTYQGTILSVCIFFTSVEHNYFVRHQNRHHRGSTATQYLHIKQIAFLFNSIHFESTIFSL